MLLHKITLLAYATIASALDLTQVITEIPTCALNCSITALSTTSPACGLSALDATCLCSNTTLQLSISSCIQGVCNFTEQLQVAEANNDLCPDRKIESRGPHAVWIGVGMGTVTLICVLLRFYSRFVIASRLWLDDWAILVAAILYCGIITTDVLDWQLGFGRHLWNVEIKNIIPLAKVFLASEVLYVFVLVATKVSILLFYLRVFTRPWFRRAVCATIIFVCVWGTTFSLVALFPCRPVNAYSAAGIGIAQDVLILLLPIPELKSLQMNLKKKVNTIVMFSIGSLACITSIVRLKFIVRFGNSLDPTWDNVTPAIWSLIEINVAMICACLPAIRVIISHWIPSLGLISTTRWNSNNPNTNTKSTTSSAGWSGSRRGTKPDIYDGELELTESPDTKVEEPSTGDMCINLGGGGTPHSLRSGTGSEDDLVFPLPPSSRGRYDVESLRSVDKV